MASATDLPSVRLYAPVRHPGSFGSLAAGFREGLDDIGAAWHLFPYDMSPDEQGWPTDGCDADIGVYLGEPSHMGFMDLHAQHKKRFLMVAPNGDGVPPYVFDRCKKHGVEIIVPSAWAASVVQDYTGVTPAVVPHGVRKSDWPKVDSLSGPDLALHMAVHHERLARLYRCQAGSARLNLLHVTSTVSDRKGTMQLIDAWSKGRCWSWGTLTIKADRLTAPHIRHKIEQAECVDVTVIDRAVPMPNPVSGDAWGDFLRSFSAVVQPSMAEGYGCVPLEAVANGVPAILTDVTGHREYIRAYPHIPEPEGEFTYVAHGELGPMEGEPYQGYSVTPEAVLAALDSFRKECVTRTHQAASVALAYRSTYSWGRILRSWLSSVEIP